VDLSFHNTNPPSVFDREAVALTELSDVRLEEGIVAFRTFVEEQGCFPTEASWTAAGMSPSERTMRRRFGSFRSAAVPAGIEAD
jgi:hypothetical protein